MNEKQCSPLTEIFIRQDEINSLFYRHFLNYHENHIFVKISKVKERPDIGVYVKDLSAYVVNNADDMDKTMTLGNKNRK